MRIALLTHHAQMKAMNGKRIRWTEIPLVRGCLVGLGVLLMMSAAVVGPLPGPGGIIVFAAGLSIVLKYSGWAKRLYVRFKRKHPRKGHWVDWGLRRRSARRREEMRKRSAAGDAPVSD